MSHALLNAIRRTAAGLTILTAAAACSASPAQAGSVITTDCLHNFGYDHGFGYGRSYNGAYGDGYFGGNASAYGSGSSHGYGDGGCVEIRRELTNPYVVDVPRPKTDKEAADTSEHERLWRARCRPILRQDAYGVRRYRYAAPGCEYGRYE